MLCRTLDSIDSIQPFVFLSPDNQDNDRISCRNAHLNNFDLAPWVEINSDSNNDIKKSEDVSLSKPGKPKSTTIKPKTTRKPQKVTKVPNQNKPNAPLLNKPQKVSNRPNRTDTNDNDNNFNMTKSENSKPIEQVIDDKLDFKFKTRRYSDSDSDTRQYNNQNNDYYDDVQSVQSVVINNSPYKRPNSRPYISVTENIDKYTYLINYVPRPTQSWRQTTRRHNYNTDKNDRDVVKVTYQSYDDTYRRPNRPYYNRHDPDNNYESRMNTPTESSRSSARSNDDDISRSNYKLSTEMFVMTSRPKPLTDKTTDKVDPTTENLYKLLTFGYVGSYKGSITDDKTNTDKTKPETISKDFSIVETDKSDDTTNDINNGKLSTFLLYETATKPYNLQRPTRRNDEDESTSEVKDKYYYMHNVLRKYAQSTNQKMKNVQNQKKNEQESFKKSEILASSDKNFDIQERSGNEKIESTDEVKPTRGDKPKIGIRKPAKTPSVAFQIIPSENK